MWILLRYTLSGKSKVQLITDIVVMHEEKASMPPMYFSSRNDAMKYGRNHIIPTTFYHPVEVVQV